MKMGLVLSGQVVPTPDLVVRSYLEHGMRWPIGESGVKVRLAPPDLAVVHATGGQDGIVGAPGAKAFFDRISARKLSVEFYLDEAGELWQFLDPMIVSAAHVGGLNDRAFGIEVENRMYPVDSKLGRPMSEGAYQVVGPKYTGDDFILRDGVKLYWQRSRRKSAMGLYPVQRETLRKLAKFLTQYTSVTGQLATDKDYVRRADRKSLLGWLRHSQVTLKHGDPSVDSLELFG
jgi:hypothetical protein